MKGKKVAPSRTQFPLAQEEKPHTTRPCDACTKQPWNFMVSNCFSPPFTLFEPCGAVFIMNSKILLRKKELKRVFQSHFALFPYLFTLGLYKGCSMNELVFFLVALAEVQVAVLSVLNLPRQGFLATCRIGHCCVLQPAVICLTDTLRFAKANRQHKVNRVWII